MLSCAAACSCSWHPHINIVCAHAGMSDRSPPRRSAKLVQIQAQTHPGPKQPSPACATFITCQMHCINTTTMFSSLSTSLNIARLQCPILISIAEKHRSKKGAFASQGRRDTQQMGGRARCSVLNELLILAKYEHTVLHKQRPHTSFWATGMDATVMRDLGITRWQKL